MSKHGGSVEIPWSDEKKSSVAKSQRHEDVEIEETTRECLKDVGMQNTTYRVLAWQCAKACVADAAFEGIHCRANAC